MKKLIRVISFIIAASMLCLSASAAGFYRDVPEDSWYYEDVNALYQEGILTEGWYFFPNAECRRADFVNWLYGVHLRLGGKVSVDCEPFDDVTPDAPFYEAVMWARSFGVINGISAAEFGPDHTLTREQCCAILIRFARIFSIRLQKNAEPELFNDWQNISEYAKSDVAAAKMAGLVNGYTDGTFRPKGSIKNSEAAAIIRRMLNISRSTPADGADYVDTAEGAYLWIYTPYDYSAPVAECEEADASFFDDAVFIGDSVSLTLRMYALSSGALGEAQFLCAGSLSATNALWEVSDSSVHPSYNGVKVRVEDGVAMSGAKNVYIMLGMNEISFGIKTASGNLVKLIELIKEKSPDVNIIIESVTPMTSTSNIRSSRLNNSKIDEYNAKLLELCEENEWYFLNVAEAMKDDYGCLTRSYCSDPDDMGIHFTNAAAKMWVKYLLTHVPEPLTR